MTDATAHDTLALGNAIVDVIARVEDDALVAQGLAKGSMALIDEARAEGLLAAMGEVATISGGSAANTIAGVASLGGRGAFIGKVRDDDLGRRFADGLTGLGVTYATSPAADGPATARSFVLVTPDGERTMSTYLGAAQALSPADVDEALVRGAGTTYLEGYLWDPQQAKLAFRKAADVAHAAGRRVALTLSDGFCVDRYRDEFKALLRDGTVDVLFANEAELKSLYADSDFDDALWQLRGESGLTAFVTRGERGAVAVAAGEVIEAPARPIERLVDTTGAGDLFAAGVLHGLARGRALDDCLHLGALAAAEVIQHLGARPERSLRALAAEAGLTA